MSFLRPEVAAALHRWREVIAAGGAGLVALWFIARGGWLLPGIGIVLLLAAAGFGLVALRRLRFARPVAAPGVVEVLEGQIAYLAPEGGGWVALSELAELGLSGGAHPRWHLRQRDGRRLEIPVAAAGAERLFDVFTALPGLEARRLLRALDQAPDQAPDQWGPGLHILWLREAGPALTRAASGDTSCR
ncbi:hypothetical protein [Halodurantibacterium flavum]|uniref:Uncharacterized protein n=1 Tax=Halodurantibacterium flavum TaxID=1382802 RepID=A0ABW4S6I8_9RHOB